MLVFFVLEGMYSIWTGTRRSTSQSKSAGADHCGHAERVAGRLSATFPQPRLETNEPREINDFRLQEEQTLNSYDYVDKNAGMVRIPIDEPWN